MPWLFVINNATALHWVLSERRMAFRESVETSRLKAGDQWAIYATHRALPREESGQFVAAGEVVSDVQIGDVEIAGSLYTKSWALRVDVAAPPSCGVPVKPLVDDLKFIVYKDGWAGYLRRSMVAIKFPDFALILGELKQRV